MNMNLAKIIVDIETCAIPSVDQYLEEPQAPSNYKDPIKIADYITQAKIEALGKAGLDCDLGRIVALGWMLEGRDVEPRVMVATDEQEERAILEAFWQDVVTPAGAHRRLVSFNGLRFDLPYLMRRSLYLDLDYPRLNIDKYRAPHIDLSAVLSYHGTLKLHSLMFYAKRFGLSIPEGAAEIDGSMIQRLMDEGAWQAIQAHCESDVRITYALAARLGFIDQPAVDPHDAELEPAVGF